MMRRRKKLAARQSVDLNLAAMLDMAFQLLTFFILTFRPAPTEGEIALKLPTAVPHSKSGTDPAGRNPNAAPVGLDTLTISVTADPHGDIAALAVADQAVTLGRLEPRLRRLLADPDSDLQQVVIEADSGLRYDALMHVVDKCARQKLSGGRPLRRLSFAEPRGT